jgi:hypothetical protein
VNNLDRPSPVLDRLAQLYAASQTGRTGVASRDFQHDFRKLIEAAGCTSGERHANARADIEFAEQQGALQIERHRRDASLWRKVRVACAHEQRLFALVGRASPTAEREAWATLFQQAFEWQVPPMHVSAWREFCSVRARDARAGLGWKPFRRAQRRRAAFQLEVAAKLLGWKNPSLLRTASVQLTGSSKFLERCASTMQSLLALGSGGAVRSFADLQIDHNPAAVRFHGPIRVCLSGQLVEYAHHGGECALSETDLAAAESIEFLAPRCVTVENATKFHELCRLRCGDIFVHTSYPNKATVQFLRCLPVELPLFHFGDTDAWGFDVLRVLRWAVGRPVEPLHMEYRAKTGSNPLRYRARRKLARLLSDPALADVREQLLQLEREGREGDYEQESLLVSSPGFPYVTDKDGGLAEQMNSQHAYDRQN